MFKQPCTVAVIDVGDCDTQVARQVAGRFATRRLGGQTLAHRIARRISESTRIDHVVVTGANLPTSLMTAVGGFNVVEMPHSHVCERLAAAADSVDADWVVYVPGNRPFIDPALVDCLLTKALQTEGECDYVGFCGMDGGWEQVRRLGVAGEVCHADALRRLRRNIDRLPNNPDELSLANWLTAAPGVYQLKFVSIPDGLDCHDLRFAIEDELDWELAELFSDHMGDDRTEWQLLTNLVRNNHGLRGSMAERNSAG